MSRVRIAGRNVSVRDISIHGAGRAWALTSSRPDPLAVRDLRLGDRGAEVSSLRRDLRDAGIASPRQWHTLFDEELEGWVIEYQRRHRLRPDGRVGRATRESIARNVAMRR